MKSPRWEIFTITLSLFLINSTPTFSHGFKKNSKIIEIMKGSLINWIPGYLGPYPYDVSKCNSEIHDAPGGDIVRVTSNDNCINIYPQVNCTGWFIRFNYGRYPSYQPQIYPWDGDKLRNSTLQVGSVGPCFDKCDERNWQGDRKEVVQVTLYDDSEFKGFRKETVSDFLQNICI
ncbi:uncharacterized protein LOC118439427 [Folsomia candida]|uniref:uncharacterized protein LOC118439427 n=1 Tax=Folsomia candida TaxID=158441 RepID=UPI001604AF74|nr:uncharacterized protein LOC118439427 [Folsomia candida]